MPGIAGIAQCKSSAESLRDTVTQMQDLITHKDFYVKDPVFISGNCCGTRSHINVIQTSPQPCSKQKIHVWLDGEFYNSRDLQLPGTVNSGSDAELLLRLYVSDSEFNFLKHIDGGFAAVIYDESRDMVFLISDRYGRQHLYWTHYMGGIAWSSEVKAFSALPGIHVKIDPDAVEEFFAADQLFGERTWLEGVKLIRPAIVHSFNLSTQESRSTRYWRLNEPDTFSEKSDMREYAEEAGTLLIKAVKKQGEVSGERVGIALSGGRDSRAILAAMPQKGYPIHAATIGQSNCMDIRIASKVVKIKQGIHHIYEMNTANWLDGRLRSIWLTDGQSNLLHLNSKDSKIEDGRHFKIAFNGLGGEMLAGRIRAFEMSNSREFLDWKYPDLPKDSPVKERIHSYISGAADPEAFALTYRFRNFSCNGLKHGEAIGVRSRLPFFDNEYLEFVYRIPHEYKKSARLYDLMLLMKFPEFFTDLPWNHINYPAGLSHKYYYYKSKIGIKLKRMASRTGLTNKFPVRMAEYDEWMRRSPAVELIESVLMSPSALYPDYTDRNKVHSTYKEHLSGKNNSRLLGRYITFEVWLQQILNSRLRN
jgi:asparagine synthase (glutamine-hydrolysing)